MQSYVISYHFVFSFVGICWKPKELWDAWRCSASWS